MKKHLFLIVLTVLSLSAFAKHVNVETARSVAKTYWTMNIQKGNMMKSSVDFTDVTSQTEFTNFYIFNTQGGFVIVSADDIARPILAYSDEDTFFPTDIPEHVRDWLHGYESDIELGIANGVTASDEIAADWNNLLNGNAVVAKSTRAITKLIQTKWNQRAPYNNLCPGTGSDKAVTGCVATAMAQLMKYWNFPGQGDGSKTYTNPTYGTLSADFGATTYDWANMTNTYSNSSSNASKNAVATLMYHCGVSVEMRYGAQGSGAATLGSSISAESALKKYFFYKSTLKGYNKSSFSDETWINMLKGDLNFLRPILYKGYGELGGHSFVCDGYDVNNNFHFNWGWGGRYDGFYALTCLNPDIGGTLTNNQGAVIGIEPNNGLFATPDELDISGLGGSKTFEVRSCSVIPTEWTAYSDQEWLTVTPSTGRGGGYRTTVTATAARNNTENERIGTIIIYQGSFATAITVTQPSGITQTAGCYGNQESNSLSEFVNGNMVIIRSEGFGYFETGNVITSVNFTTCDYNRNTNNNFEIRIYEGGSVDGFVNRGYTTDIASAIGNLVYSQDYTQTSYGEQNVYLETPYVINDNTNFWVAVVMKGNSAIRENYTNYGNPIPVGDYSSCEEAYDGKYLFIDTYCGNNYINTCTGYNTIHTPEENIQIYGFEYALSFCVQNPTDILQVMPETLSFNGEGESKTLNVRAAISSTNWAASTNADWLSITPSTGSGDGTNTEVTVTAARNTTENQRSAEITITQGSETKVIPVTQLECQFSVTPANLEFTSAAGSRTVTIQASGSPEGWRIFTMLIPSWLSISQSSGEGSGSCTNITISVAQNTNNEERSAVLSIQQGNIIESITITQEAFITHIIAASANNANAGFIEGAGTYSHGASVTLTATEVVGFQFLNWVENGEFVSSSPSYTFTATEDRTLVANFMPRRYSAYATAVPYNYGTVFGTGSSYEFGQNVILVASPNVNYSFVNWTENDSVVSTNMVYCFAITSNRNLVAHFALATYDVTIDTNPIEGGTVSGAGTYDGNDNVTISATANTGYTFTNWTEVDTVVSTSADYSFQIIEDRYFVANFTPNTYTITASSANMAYGTVTGGGDYDYGTAVTLTANPVAHYHFVSWDDGNTQNPRIVTVLGDATYTATFTKDQHTVTVVANPTEGGTITGNGTYEFGTEITLTATANDGYHFVSWSDDPTAPASRSYTVNSDTTFTANFERTTYTITATASLGGNISPEGPVVVAEHNSVSFTMTPNQHYGLTSVIVDGRDVIGTMQNNTYIFNDVTENHSIAAYFTELSTYTVTTSATPTEGGSTTGSGTYYRGDNVVVTATANTHYTFTNWTEGDEVVSNDASYSFYIDDNRNLVANFQIDRYTIVVDGENCTTTGSGTYDYGQTVQISATANEHYHFVRWNDGNTESIRTITVSADSSFTAICEIDQYTITATANGNGSVTGGGVKNYGEIITLTAVPDDGYRFVRWNDDETENPRQHTVVANAEFVAYFEIIPVTTYTITATAGEGGTITPEGTVSVNEGESKTFEIRANENHIIGSIIIDGEGLTMTEEVRTEYDYTFENVTSDHTISVTFVDVTAIEITEVGSISVFPNPTRGTFSIDFSAIEGNITYQLINANGSTIDSRKMNVSNGSVKELSYNLAPGVYFVRIISNESTWTERITICR